MSIALYSRSMSAMMLAAVLAISPAGAFAAHHGHGDGHSRGHDHGGGGWGIGIYAMPVCGVPGYAPPPVYYPCGYYAPPSGVYYPE